MSCVSKNYTIENRKWYLMEIEGDADISVLNDKDPFIEFDLDSKKISGYGTCNNYFADYFIEGETLHFGEIASTERFCSDDTRQEYRFLQALNRTESFKLEGDMLYFYEGDDFILIFSSVRK